MHYHTKYVAIIIILQFNGMGADIINVNIYILSYWGGGASTKLNN